MKIEHLSPSSFNMMIRCGMQWFFRYVEGLKRPPGVALVIGTGVDKGVNLNMEQKMETGNLAELAEVKQKTFETVVNTFEMSEIALDDDEKKKGMQKVKDEAADMAVSLSAVHYQKAAPKIFPVAVQERWELEVDGYPFETLMGIIDISETNVVRDTKTTKRSPSGGEADKSDQLNFYAYYKKVAEDKNVETVLDFLVKLKTNPKFVPVYTSRPHTDEDFNRLWEKIDAVSLAIEKEVFLPTLPDNWWCSPKWCGYYDVCKFARR